MSALRNIAGAINSIANTGYDMGNRRIKLGYITSYDPKSYTVRVRLEPESAANELAGDQPGIVESGWLPIWRPYGGKNWGWVSPPNANSEPPYGDQCLVLHPDGGQGIALIGMYNKVEPSYEKTKLLAYSSAGGSSSTSDSGTYKANEVVIKHPNGNLIQMLNDGSLRLQGMFDGSLGMLLSMASNKTLALVNAHSKTSLRLASDGTIELRAWSNNIQIQTQNDINALGGGNINVLGGGNSSGTEIITKTHLTLFAQQVAAQFAARQGGTSGTPVFVITGSANVKCSD